MAIRRMSIRANSYPKSEKDYRPFRVGGGGICNRCKDMSTPRRESRMDSEAAMTKEQSNKRRNSNDTPYNVSGESGVGKSDIEESAAEPKDRAQLEGDRDTDIGADKASTSDRKKPTDLSAKKYTPYFF